MSRLINLSRKAVISNPNNPLQQLRHNHYMSRLFPLSNSSFQLSNSNSLQASVVRLTDQMYLVDSGIASPKTCLQDELVGTTTTNNNNNNIRFENRVGFLDSSSGESPIRLQILERFFIDLVAGDKAAKDRALSRFNDLFGGADVDGGSGGGGEAKILLPRRYRQRRVGMELNKIWRSNSRVKGFYVGRNRSGFAVAIAGFVAFFPNRPDRERLLKDRFTIQSFNPKTGNLVVL